LRLGDALEVEELGDRSQIGETGAEGLSADRIEAAGEAVMLSVKSVKKVAPIG
jgi:hypothetical protein